MHEIKHDGYRLFVRRDGPSVRLFTRRGATTGPTGAIAGPAAKLRARSFALDGEGWSAGPMAWRCSALSTGGAVLSGLRQRPLAPLCPCR
jgi:ATP-dependent DNA ligase